jgi:tetratricopeptide (TPR) repeat protein
MSPKTRQFALLAALVACVSVGLAFAARTAFHPAPSLERVGPLARAGRFDQALALVEDYLRAHPEAPRARLMAAELALDQPTPNPELALEHLRRFASDDRHLSAVAQLDEGKASYLLGQYDQAEACWRRALELDPTVPEAAWALLDLYYLEGRGDDARQVALRQYALEPDRRDRARLLLELVRQDAEPPAAASVVNRFAPVVGRDTNEFRAAIALGLALVHSGRPEAGTSTLREVVRRRPDDPDAWDALLTGLDDADRPDELGAEVGRLTPALAADPRLARHLGRAAQARRDWPAAAAAYRRAWEARPHDLELLYRLDTCLRNAGDVAGAGAGELEALKRSAQSARAAVPALHAEANARRDFGAVADPGLYRRLAENREGLGRRDEARAWHLLVLRDFPDDRVSRAEAERLK